MDRNRLRRLCALDDPRLSEGNQRQWLEPRAVLRGAKVQRIRREFCGSGTASGSPRRTVRDAAMRGVCKCGRLLDWRYGDGEHVCASCREKRQESLPPAIEPRPGEWQPVKGRIGGTEFGNGRSGK